jgi:hypothetical protein
MSLQDSSLIVTLKLSQWTARKLDRKVTDEVNTQHNASADAGRYNKLLVSKEHMEKIQKIVNAVRTYHYQQTLNWGDNNERLLTTENFFDYSSQMQKYQGEFEKEVKAFLKNYDRVIEEAKVRLNGMFREADYPNRSEIQEKFGFDYKFFPVPDSDMRVKLGKADVKKLTEKLEAEINTRIGEAVKDVWGRVKEQLVHMKEKLSNSEAIFRDSLFGNLKELVALIPKLNVTKDANIARVCNEMAGLVADPDDVRNNPSVRSQKAKEVDAMMKKFGSFFSK